LTTKVITLREAQTFVATHHRHHGSPVGHKLSIGVRINGTDDLVGVAIVSRPVARLLDDGGDTLEVKAARKAARESALAANADLARRTKLNVEDLTRFFASTSRADGVDEWLAARVAALQEQAARRREAERRQAGAALAAMRERGEQVRDIARLAQISDKLVRELIRLAESVPAAAQSHEAKAEASVEVAEAAAALDAAEAGIDGLGTGRGDDAGLAAVGR
jgi:hypothetical protein